MFSQIPDEFGKFDYFSSLSFFSCSVINPPPPPNHPITLTHWLLLIHYWFNSLKHFFSLQESIYIYWKHLFLFLMICNFNCCFIFFAVCINTFKLSAVYSTSWNPMFDLESCSRNLEHISCKSGSL